MIVFDCSDPQSVLNIKYHVKDERITIFLIQRKDMEDDEEIGRSQK
jgi:hypothetical protein